MAEPVSSIITIALLGVAVIKGCKAFLDEVREIDELVDRLQRKVTDLHRVVCVLNSIYQQAEPEDASEPWLLVRGEITQCRDRFRAIKPKIFELEARSTETFVDRVSLKRKMDAVAKDIEVSINDIQQHLAVIGLVTGAWSHLEVTSLRRASEPAAVHGPAQDDPGILDRWLSDGETMGERINNLRDSTTTPPEPLSVVSSSPTGLLTQSDDGDSVFSAQTPVTLYPSEDWRDFHETVLRCQDGSAMIQKVHSRLKEHPEPRALVNILGDLKRAPLHLAAMRGYVEVARILLEFGGDIHAKDTEPASVLDHALANKQVDFVALLLDNEVDETAILEQNEKQLKKIKPIIALRKALRQGDPREKTRRFSLSIARRRSK